MFCGVCCEKHCLSMLKKERVRSRPWPLIESPAARTGLCPHRAGLFSVDAVAVEPHGWSAWQQLAANSPSVQYGPGSVRGRWVV